jgi:hypothetical protein
MLAFQDIKNITKTDCEIFETVAHEADQEGTRGICAADASTDRERGMVMRKKESGGLREWTTHQSGILGRLGSLRQSRDQPKRKDFESSQNLP